MHGVTSRSALHRDASASAFLLPADPSAPPPPFSSIDEVSELLRRHPDAVESRPNKLMHALEAFVSANEHPASSPNFIAGGVDDTRAVGPLLGAAVRAGHERLVVGALLALKILSRKEGNRERLGARTMGALCELLAAPPSERATAEACNVLLNLCYELPNVQLALGRRCVALLLPHLRTGRADVRANAAGAIQSIAYQKDGREAAVAAGAGPPLVPLLADADARVRTRAVGAVHNLSSEPAAIGPLREAGAIGPLVALLRAPAAQPCASAAGALQNLARETLAREQIRALDAAGPLTDLLFATDQECRTTATGALLNVVGPELGPEEASNAKRAAFKRVLSLSVSLGMLGERLAPDAPAHASWRVPTAADAAARALAAAPRARGAERPTVEPLAASAGEPPAVT